ncbi:hypothetical protein HYY74_02300 [Candidatus Woesearchaeota archaeon]|nr:hypothetical protein [Candidatus Woesearchaeota archaeon]
MAVLVRLPPVRKVRRAAPHITARTGANVSLVKANPIVTIAVIQRPAITEAALLETFVVARAIIRVIRQAAARLVVNTPFTNIRIIARPPAAATINRSIAPLLIQPAAISPGTGIRITATATPVCSITLAKARITTTRITGITRTATRDRLVRRTLPALAIIIIRLIRRTTI